MSSHDCRLSGVLKLAPGVTDDQVKQALQRFMNRYRVDWRVAHETGAPTFDFEGVEFDSAAHEVNIDANISAYGGYDNEVINEMREDLASLLDGPNLLVLHDYDTGNNDDAVTPYFLGPTPQDRARAQVEYALDAFEEFASHPLGTEAVAYVRTLVTRLALKVNIGTPSDDPRFKHFVVQPVTMLIAANRSKHDEPTAWNWRELMGETGDAQLLEEIPGPAAAPTTGQLEAIAEWFKDVGGNAPSTEDDSQASKLEGSGGSHRTYADGEAP
jgi:hypothetical protein